MFYSVLVFVSRWLLSFFSSSPALFSPPSLCPFLPSLPLLPSLSPSLPLSLCPSSLPRYIQVYPSFLSSFTPLFDIYFSLLSYLPLIITILEVEGFFYMVVSLFHVVTADDTRQYMTEFLDQLTTRAMY